MTSYARVELVSLLAGDLPRARAFVAGQLGPLASTAEPAERLRDTVLAFLASGGSATRVAKELYVHQNTVAYRVKRAEEMLGRKVTERPVELTCALTLAAVLGPAVLAGEDGGADPADQAYSASISAAYFAAIGLRLSFIVGVSSSPPATQSSGSTANRLICSTRASFSLARSICAATSACGSSTVAAASRVERDERDVVGPRVADRAHAADHRAGRLDRRLDVRRRHVLAGGADDQLLDAVDDPQVAVVVEDADVAGVHPAVGVERLGRRVGAVAVAAHDDRRRASAPRRRPTARPRRPAAGGRRCRSARRPGALTVATPVVSDMP